MTLMRPGAACVQCGVPRPAWSPAFAVLPALAALAACGAVERAAPEVAPITVVGEASSSQARPTWLWDAVAGADRVSVTLAGAAGPLTGELAADATRWTATQDLGEGPYTLTVEAFDDLGDLIGRGSAATTIERFDRAGTWRGVMRGGSATPLGRDVLIACQACFQTSGASPADNLHGTLSRIHTAQASGADVIELAVSETGGVWYVGADGAATGAVLGEVLANPDVAGGDQLLTLDLVESQPTKQTLRALLDIVVGHDHARNGRPLIVRAEAALADGRLVPPPGLLQLKEVVTADAYPLHHAYLRYHVVVPPRPLPVETYTFLGELAAHAEGAAPAWQGIDLDAGNEDLFGGIVYARMHGLGVGVRGVHSREHCAAFRDAVDTVATTDDVSACVGAVSRTPALVHVDPAERLDHGNQLAYHVGATAHSMAVDAAAQPHLHRDETEDRYGISIYFKEVNDNLVLPASDVDAAGYLVAAVVNFDTLTLPAPMTGEAVASIVTKRKDATGFGLEVARAAGSTIAQLRFRVFVNGRAHAATMDLGATVNGDDSYLVVGSYDGAGPVRLWLNGVEGTPSGNVVGAVGANDALIALGAEPAAVAATSWRGLVQMMTIQAWPTPD
jgi:hypothetical protein